MGTLLDSSEMIVGFYVSIPFQFSLINGGLDVFQQSSLWCLRLMQLGQFCHFTFLMLGSFTVIPLLTSKIDRRT